MATLYWTGRAAAVAQVTTVAFSSIVATNTYTLTVNGKSVSYVAASTSGTDLYAALAEAWNTSEYAELQEMSASGSALAVTLTANNAGVPVTVTASATTGSATVTNTTAASGPAFWNVAANWTGTPAGGDTLILRDFTGDILYGLTDTNNYALIEIEASFEGAIGLPSTNANGYPEYRTQRLTLGSGSALAVTVGYGAGDGSNRILLDVNGSNTTLTVFRTSGGAGDAYALRVQELGASSTVRVYGGSVECSASTVTTLDIVESGAVPVVVRVDSGSTAGVVTMLGGTLLLEGNVTTLIARGGAVATVARAAAAATVKVGSESTVNWDTSGGITTTLDVEAGGVADFGRVASTKTVAACKLFSGGAIRDPLDKVTWTAGVVLQACRIEDVTLDLGFGITIA